MKSIVKGGVGAMSTKNMILAIFLAIVLVVFVVLVALYGFGDSEDRFDDPVIQGDKDVGSVITYDVVEGGSGTFDMEIIGQSGSYYFADVTSLATLAGSETYWLMFHKETGLLRFSEEGEEITFDFEGEEITLIESLITGEEGDVWVFASSEDDGVPYIIECTVGDVTVKAELNSIDGIVEPTGDYERSEALDEYYIYSFEGTMHGEGSTGNIYFYTVADCNGGLGLLMLTDSTYIDGDGNEVEETTVGYELSTSMLDFLYQSFTFGLPPVGTEEKSTIDGDILCSKYYFNYMGAEVTSFIDEDTQIIYEAFVDMPGDVYTAILEEYFVPA